VDFKEGLEMQAGDMHEEKDTCGTCRYSVDVQLVGIDPDPTADVKESRHDRIMYCNHKETFELQLGWVNHSGTCPLYESAARIHRLICIA
jgi:hypothetical protein